MSASNRFGNLAIIPTDPESGSALAVTCIILRGKRKNVMISREFPGSHQAALGTGRLQEARLVKKWWQKGFDTWMKEVEARADRNPLGFVLDDSRELQLGRLPSMASVFRSQPVKPMSPNSATTLSLFCHNFSVASLGARRAANSVTYFLYKVRGPWDRPRVLGLLPCPAGCFVPSLSAAEPQS